MNINWDAANKYSSEPLWCFLKAPLVIWRKIVGNLCKLFLAPCASGCKSVKTLKSPYFQRNFKHHVWKSNILWIERNIIYSSDFGCMQIAKIIKKIEESKIWYTNFSWNIWFKLSSLNYIFLLSYQYILFHSSELKTEKHMYLLLYWIFFQNDLDFSH